PPMPPSLLSCCTASRAPLTMEPPMGSFSGFGASTPMVIGPSILALPPPPPELLVSLLPLLPLPLPPLLELLFPPLPPLPLPPDPFPPLPPPPPRLRQPATVAASAAPPVARKNVRRFA